ncbi:MAG: lytic transglycosylase domain-containing protein [Rudaea sp.]
MRILLPLGLLCALAPWPAFAGGVFKCVGPDGQIAFTNQVGTFKHCEKVSSYVDQPASSATTPKNTSAHTDYRTAPAAPNAAVDSTAAADTTTKTDASYPSSEVRRGAVYKVAKSNGITEYTNVRPAHGGYQMLFTYIATCFACNVHSTIDFAHTPLNVNAFNTEIAAAAGEFGVDPAFVRAIVHAESAFNPNAVSLKGAQGLMQLMPGTASDLGVNNPFDAVQNIRGGTLYLSQLLKQFNGDEKLAAAAYDAGAQNVQKYKGVPPFDETQVYVQRVAQLRQRYGTSAAPTTVAAAGAPPRS